MEAFRLMNEKGVGGVPVVATGTMKLIGNISASDVHFLLSTPEIFKSCRWIQKPALHEILIVDVVTSHNCIEIL